MMPADVCPYEAIPSEAFEAAAAFQDYERGFTPVTLGWSTWVPPVFVETMREFRSARSFEESEAKRRSEAKAKRRD